MCAAVLNDREKQRFVDRIRVVTFHEARDTGAAPPYLSVLGCSTVWKV